MFLLCSSERCFPLCDSDIFDLASSEWCFPVLVLLIFSIVSLERCLPNHGLFLPLLASDILLIVSLDGCFLKLGLFLPTLEQFVQNLDFLHFIIFLQLELLFGFEQILVQTSFFFFN